MNRTTESPANERSRGADRIIAASDSESETLVEQYRVNPGRIAVAPCGVDTVRFRPMNRERARLALGLDPSLPVLLFVGRIESLKGIEVLIRAAAEIESRYQLVVVEGGDERDAARKALLDNLAVETGITGNVHFLDAVPHDDLPDVFNAADICVVPSYYESFGLVALEAMACSVPVIASRVGGLKETITDGQSGYLVPWRCPEPFAERLDRCSERVAAEEHGNSSARNGRAVCMADRGCTGRGHLPRPRVGTPRSRGRRARCVAVAVICRVCIDCSRGSRRSRKRSSEDGDGDRGAPRRRRVSLRWHCREVGR